MPVCQSHRYYCSVWNFVFVFICLFSCVTDFYGLNYFLRINSKHSNAGVASALIANEDVSFIITV